MAVTREEIARWFDEGKTKSATHMIIVCDTFDYEDFPVYVLPNEDARKKAEEEKAKPMQKVMEVYSLSLPMESQLEERRAFHYD